MPLDMAVKQPNTRVIGLEAQDDIAVGVEDEGISSHGDGGEGGGGNVGVLKGASFFFGAVEGLEVVPVEMEGMTAWVDVVDDDFDDLVFFQDEAVRVGAVNGWVGGEGAGGEGRVEGWDFGVGVGYVVEEGTGCM